MQEPVTISRNTPDHPSKDYALLREEGLNFVQQLASNLWTDYNIHDPGITILEQLAYAITELGYRAGLDTKDILAPNPETGRSLADDFYTARQILPNAPVTEADFKKILIDIKGIKNAFFDPSANSEKLVFIDEDAGSLSYDITPEQLLIRGLYNVTLELDEDEDLGDLNSNFISRRVVVDGFPLLVQFIFPNWFEVDELFRTSFSINSVTVNEVKFLESGDYIFSLNINNGEAELTVETDVVTSLTGKNIEDNDLQQRLEQLLTSNPFDLLQFFNRKIAEIWSIVDQVKIKLQAQRNLCEDFLEVKNLQIEEVAICAKIEVESGFDVSEVLGQVYFEIGAFLSPRVEFRTLQELLDEGEKVEDIFNGPLLENGFVKDEQFATLADRKEVHTSDLINIIMDIPGVIGIRDLELSSFVDGDNVANKVVNTLRQAFPQSHKFRLSVNRSNIIFYRDEDPLNPSLNYILANRENVLLKIEELKALNPRFAKVSANSDLPLPDASYRNLTEYYSIQNDFPLTYGITRFGTKPLPDKEANEVRLAQAKQLKAYLLFSEQLLTNYYAQLDNVKNLFSVSAGFERTYFTKPIYDVPHVGNLIKDFVENVLPSDQFVDDQQTVNQFFESYVSQPSPFSMRLDEIAESETEFKDRQDRIFQHMLARFAEDFSEYSLKMFESFGEDEVLDDVLEDKKNFLQNVSLLSSERFQAFNQKDEGNVWTTDNISGYVKRVSGKIGLKNSDRRSLYFQYDERLEDIQQQFVLNQTSAETTSLFGTVGNSVDSNGSTIGDWEDIGQGINDDGDYAQTPQMTEGDLSDYYQVTGFDFTSLPADAEILGITVEIKKSRNNSAAASQGGELIDDEVRLLKTVGLIGDNKARSENWPTTSAPFTYGGNDDLWGTTWTLADLNTDFGVAISVRKIDPLIRRARIFYINVNVAYVVPGQAHAEQLGTVALGGDGLYAWQNPTNVLVDGTEAQTPNIPENEVSDYLKVQGFDFSGIPANSIIRGLEVIVKKRRTNFSGGSNGGEIRDKDVRLIINDELTGENKALPGLWPTSGTPFTYGGNEDLWRTDLTLDDLNSAGFGVAFRVEKIDPNERAALVDNIKVIAYFSDTDLRYSFDLQGDLAGFETSGRASGYKTTSDRADVISDFVLFGKDACNYCNTTSYSTVSNEAQLPTVVDAGVGSFAWENENNILLHDASFAQTVPLDQDQTSQLIRVSGFDFSSIPTGSVILGVGVDIERRRTNSGAASQGGEIIDEDVRLILDGDTIGENRARNVLWPTSSAVETYGGQNDQWGALLNLAVIQNPGFGVSIRARKLEPLLRRGQIDFVQITVYYANPSDAQFGFSIKKITSDAERNSLCGKGEGPTPQTIPMTYPIFNTEAECQNRINELSSALWNIFWQEEGIHLVEHLLLRPKLNEVNFIDINVDEFSSSNLGLLAYEKLIPVALSVPGLRELYFDVDLTAELNAGDSVRLLDDCDGILPTILQEVSLEGAQTKVIVELDLDSEFTIVGLFYPRQFVIDQLDKVGSTIQLTINGQDLVNDLNLVDQFQITGSARNDGTYARTFDPTLIGGNTEIVFSQVESFTQDAFLPISLEEEEDNCLCPILRDPYGFRMTAIMPGWAGRFTENSFRKLVEKTLRLETPAHVFLKIVWANLPQMNEFEQAYKAWLGENAKAIPNIGELNRTQVELVEKFTALNTQSNAAILEDISEDDDGGEVLVLGNTILG